jgi:hypothetical protein
MASIHRTKMQIEPSHGRLLSRVLSRPTFAELARGDFPTNFVKCLKEVPGLAAGKSVTVGLVLERAYKALCLAYRNEYVYKTAIANRIVFGRHSPRTSSMQTELPVGRSIVDVAVFNGTSTAYEIKTELDTPRRLVTQTRDYLTAFEYVYVVTAPTLADEYASLCASNVGILALDRRESLRIVRKASSNHHTINPSVLFRMLRRDEYVPALEQATKKRIELPNGVVGSHCEKLFGKLESEYAHSIFLRAMRSRSTNEEQVDFLYSLPTHLRALGYATPLSRPQRKRLLDILDSSLALI